MNAVHLIGRLTHDPRTSRTDRGTTVANMRIAIDRAGDGTDFVSVTAWHRLAETAAAYLCRGRRVAITGRLRHQEWTDETGQRSERLTVVADRIEFLDPPSIGQTNETDADARQPAT